MSHNILHHCYTPRSVGAQRYIVANNGIMYFNNSIGEQASRIDEHGSMCMIADGISGLKNDRLAVELAILLFRQLYMLGVPEFDVQHLKQFVEQGHQEIRTTIKQRNLPLMGASFVVLWVFEGKAMWLSIGNSRLYQYRDQELKQISSDHSVAEFIRREWMHGNPTQKLAQGWLFGSKIPNKAQHIFLTEGYDFGVIETRPNDRFMLINHAFDLSCDDQQRLHMMQASSLSSFPVENHEQEQCVVCAHIQ